MRRKPERGNGGNRRSLHIGPITVTIFDVDIGKGKKIPLVLSWF